MFDFPGVTISSFGCDVCGDGKGIKVLFFLLGEKAVCTKCHDEYAPMVSSAYKRKKNKALDEFLETIKY